MIYWIQHIKNPIYKINQNKCIKCGTCVASCPVGAISFDNNGNVVINKDICISCGSCAATCPVGAPVEE